MGRRTGDYLLGTSFLAVALFLAMSQEKSESGLLRPEERGVSHGIPASHWTTESGRRQLPSVAAFSPQPTHAVLKNLSRGTRIVVGSLDVSGRRHQLSVAIGSNDSMREVSFPVLRFSINDIARWRNAERLPTPMCRRIETQRLLPDISACNHSVNETSARVFLTPHFRDTGTVHEPAECRFIGESPRVRVYADRRLMQSTTAGKSTPWSQSLTSAAELRALPVVYAWIGAINDVDYDQKLSIVVTDLDHRSRSASHSSPIYGCIREADFQSNSDFCGDIVYIDPSIFELPTDELAALLTHEITHAAVCSIKAEKSLGSTDPAGSGTQPAGLQVPPWLSEATAHFVELQCGDADAGAAEMSENFQRRMDAFFADPAGSPIVAAEDVLSLEERRSGSRGAATLFLARWISSAEALQQVLRSDAALDRRIEQLAEEPFADVFRHWTLSLATMSTLPSARSSEHNSLRLDRFSAASKQTRFSLLGTAFRCFECSDDIASLVIESDDGAQLQISIIEPEARICSAKMD
ncbi:MAG: hypothetical protein H7Z17_17640 [Fuerstia sp.]|nr:hypothetical protein [Fuerstiella sp.]